MKQKDIALILVIVFISGVISFIVSNQFISSPKHDEKAAIVEPITAEFKEPNSAYFNGDSVNPTQLIRIETNENKNPISDNN